MSDNYIKYNYISFKIWNERSYYMSHQYWTTPDIWNEDTYLSFTWSSENDSFFIDKAMMDGQGKKGLNEQQVYNRKVLNIKAVVLIL